MKHPMQPIEMAKDGVVRFRANAIVDWLFNTGRIDLNEIAFAAARKQIPGCTDDDQMQLAMLLGYSVSGFGDLSYADESVVSEADDIAARLASTQPSNPGLGPTLTDTGG